MDGRHKAGHDGDRLGDGGRDGDRVGERLSVLAGGFTVASGREVAQAVAAALGLAAQMAGVGAHEVALDLAAVAMVPGFVRAAMGDHRPEFGLELRRHRLGAVAGDVLAVAGPELPAGVAVLPPLGEQADRTPAGELVERDLGLPVGFVAGRDVVGAGGLAVVAARFAAAGPAVRRVAPRGGVAAPRVGAEQLLRRRAVLAEGVVGDLQPVVPVRHDITASRRLPASICCRGGIDGNFVPVFDRAPFMRGFRPPSTDSKDSNSRENSYGERPLR